MKQTNTRKNLINLFSVTSVHKCAIQNHSRLHMQRKQISRKCSISVKKMKWLLEKTCMMKEIKGDKDIHDLQIEARTFPTTTQVYTNYFVFMSFIVFIC